MAEGTLSPPVGIEQAIARAEREAAEASSQLSRASERLSSRDEQRHRVSSVTVPPELQKYLDALKEIEDVGEFDKRVRHDVNRMMKTPPKKTTGSCMRSPNSQFRPSQERNSNPIYGIGRNYNRELGKGAYRTGCAIRLSTSLDNLLLTLKNNFLEAAEDPKSTVRLMVQGNKFWFSDAGAELVFERCVCVGDGKLAQEQRLHTVYDEAVPVALCVCEAVSENESIATWLFRHDVIDGWRCLRYLTALCFENTVLTMEKLKSRFENRKKPSLCTSIVNAAAPIALTPAAVGRIAELATMPTSIEGRKRFYCHMICSLAELKTIGKRCVSHGPPTARAVAWAAPPFPSPWSWPSPPLFPRLAAPALVDRRLPLRPLFASQEIRSMLLP